MSWSGKNRAPTRFPTIFIFVFVLNKQREKQETRKKIKITWYFVNQEKQRLVWNGSINDSALFYRKVDRLLSYRMYCKIRAGTQNFRPGPGIVCHFCVHGVWFSKVLGRRYAYTTVRVTKQHGAVYRIGYTWWKKLAWIRHWSKGISNIDTDWNERAYIHPYTWSRLKPI